jgi:hypothetical protein
VRLSIKLRRLAFVVGGCVMFLMPSLFLFSSSSSFSWGFLMMGLDAGLYTTYSFFLGSWLHPCLSEKRFQFCFFAWEDPLHTYLCVFIFSSSSSKVAFSTTICKVCVLPLFSCD